MFPVCWVLRPIANGPLDANDVVVQNFVFAESRLTLNDWQVELNLVVAEVCRGVKLIKKFSPDLTPPERSQECILMEHLCRWGEKTKQCIPAYTTVCLKHLWPLYSFSSFPAPARCCTFQMFPMSWPQHICPFLMYDCLQVFY